MPIAIAQVIANASSLGASDIHLVCGLPIQFRVDGALCPQGAEQLSHSDCEAYAQELAGAQFEELARVGELDLALSFGAVRVRINIYRQQGHYSAAIRLLRNEIPDLYTLGLPAAAMELTKLPRGIVVVTGETGSGKSTTLAAMLEEINRTQGKHIITLEDPVEYIYEPKMAIVNQREVHKDTQSYASGLRAALREDPDIILIGEMRDLETIETAITAAETGHLVFATLHTNSAPDSIDRIVDVFPPGRQQQIRMQLSMTLKAVLSQQLLPKLGGGRALACELMMVNGPIRNLIREGKTPQIANSMASAAKEGSVTMDRAISELLRKRLISRETAVEAAHDPELVTKLVNTF